jgi:hypothetical protein
MEKTITFSSQQNIKIDTYCYARSASARLSHELFISPSQFLHDKLTLSGSVAVAKVAIALIESIERLNFVHVLAVAAH